MRAIARSRGLGVLTVRLPKAAKAKPLQIAIGAADKPVKI